MRASAAAESLAGKIERATGLDRIADVAATWIRSVVRPGPVEDVLSGTPAGHPAHPIIVAVPIGAWTLTTVLDLTGADEQAANHAQLLGIVSALPAAATGASDWLTTAGAERRVGLVHAALNYTALALHTASWFARRAGRRRAATTLGLAGSGLVAGAGWLGGHLVYALGVGVDTTAFQSLPSEWTDALAESDVPETGLTHVEVAGVPVLFARHEGRIVAYANRCTHRGAGLDEGTVENGCVVCPWHGSAFALADGSVRSGPATRPQPALEVRTANGRVRVRRSEERTLRTNPVGR